MAAGRLTTPSNHTVWSRFKFQLGIAHLPAPFAQYIATWSCRRVWERAAIDCVTNACEQLHTEVFRATSLEQITTRAKSFFAMMPNLEQDSEDDGAEQEPETGERDA